jgi:protein gp37
VSGKTGISWCDTTWNPIRGCSRVSEGCRHCYAEEMAARIVRMGKGKPTPYDGLVTSKLKVISDDEQHVEAHWTGQVSFDADKLAEPLHWRKPKRIFVNSMSDLFHVSLTNDQIAAVFGVMAACPQHTFMVLTKRSKRMREWFGWRSSVSESAGYICARLLNAALDVIPEGTRMHIHSSWPLPNVWIGVSVENQAAADERIPDLLATPAAVRFLSCEPLIGPVDLDMGRCDDPYHGESEWGLADDDATPWCNECDEERSFGHWLRAEDGIDWVIAGCESGPGARQCDVDWMRSIRDQCTAESVPFFLKQARETEDANGCPPIGFGDGSKRKAGGVIELPYLDGVQHAELPTTTTKETP